MATRYINPFPVTAIVLLVQYPMTTLDIFEAGVTSIRWWKWFTETGEKIAETGQIHSHPYYC